MRRQNQKEWYRSLAVRIGHTVLERVKLNITHNLKSVIIPREVWKSTWYEVRKELRRLKPSTLGWIAAVGRNHQSTVGNPQLFSAANICQAHDAGPFTSPRDRLIELAGEVVVAFICEQLYRWTQEPPVLDLELDADTDLDLKLGEPITIYDLDLGLDEVIERVPPPRWLMLTPPPRPPTR